ncbi:phage tail length tape measure family protein, partial [Pseudomonas sp. MF6772]|uniref:phage tail length tape measure family protein n=1 Tax=Pseudomonas sp. MF6772 TaxID=2797533 RepID=UPI0018E7AFB0
AKISAQLDKQQVALAKSALDEQKALNSLLGAIDPARAALAKLDTQVEQLGKHLDAGRISQDQYNTALSKIDKDYAKLEKTATGFDKLRLGTRQAQENVVQLGNALSSGDWGSGVRAVAQLGAGAGAGAAGLLAILAPLALATAAVGGLAVAYYKGSEEQDRYNKSLILTGNYAGVSAGQLGDMARQVSATVGTTGQAAAVLAMLADNGKIAGDSLTGITQAAVSMQEATGKAVSETVAEFVKLADDPVKASAALNDQYHYLTASVYSQIAALEEQGDHAGAVKLATEQYADAINERTPKILENLSFWERAYNAVAQAADGLKNAGRRDINADIENARAGLAEAQGMDGLFQNQKSKDALIEFRQNRLNMLEDEKAAQEDIAKWEGEQAKAQGAAVTAMTKVDALTKSSLTNEQKRTKELEDYKQQLADIRKVSPNDPRLQQDAVDKNIANINAKFKDPKASGSQVDLTSFNSAKNDLAAITDTYKNYQKELDAAQKAGLLSEADYLLRRQALIGNQLDQTTAAYEAEIAALEAAKGKKTTSAAQ